MIEKKVILYQILKDNKKFKEKLYKFNKQQGKISILEIKIKSCKKKEKKVDSL